MTIKHFLTVFLLAAFALMSACGGKPGEPSSTDRALDELQKKYDELTDQEFEDPVQWAAEDLENIGDWDYKVLELDDPSATELEEALNELGNDRWQAFWVERTADGYRILLKKPSISYLSKIPLSQLGRFVIPGSDSAE